MPRIPLQMLMPYLLIVAGSSIISVFHPNSPFTTGYLYLTIFNVLTYVALLVIILACHRVEHRGVNQGYHGTLLSSNKCL